MTLTGGLFYSKSTVTVGGQRVQTTFVDATHLKAVVSPDIIKAAGSYDVVVNNPSTPASSGGTLGDGGASNALQYVTQGQTQQGQIGMTASLNRLNANTVQAQITLTNQGASSLSNMVAQFAALGGGLNPMTGLPYTVGTMKTGDVKTLTLQFPCPAAAEGPNYRPGSVGDYDGGTLQQQRRCYSSLMMQGSRRATPTHKRGATTSLTRRSPLSARTRNEWAWGTQQPSGGKRIRFPPDGC